MLVKCIAATLLTYSTPFSRALLIPGSDHLMTFFLFLFSSARTAVQTQPRCFSVTSWQTRKSRNITWNSNKYTKTVCFSLRHCSKNMSQNYQATESRESTNWEYLKGIRNLISTYVQPWNKQSQKQTSKP